MKDLWKYILTGIVVIFAEWIFVALIADFFNGSSYEVAVTIGVGFFLAFEMVICTGLILSNLKKGK